MALCIPITALAVVVVVAMAVAQDRGEEGGWAKVNAEWVFQAEDRTSDRAGGQES